MKKDKVYELSFRVTQLVTREVIAPTLDEAVTKAYEDGFGEYDVNADIEFDEMLDSWDATEDEAREDE